MLLKIRLYLCYWKYMYIWEIMKMWSVWPVVWVDQKLSFCFLPAVLEDVWGFFKVFLRNKMHLIRSKIHSIIGMSKNSLVFQVFHLVYHVQTILKKFFLLVTLYFRQSEQGLQWLVDNFSMWQAYLPPLCDAYHFVVQLVCVVNHIANSKTLV